MDDETAQHANKARMLAALYEMKAVFLETRGNTHPHIEFLLDAEGRTSDASLNYLAATASGTLRDCYFTDLNGDVEPPIGFELTNRRYMELLEAASNAADALHLPCVRDLHK